MVTRITQASLLPGRRRQAIKPLHTEKGIQVWRVSADRTIESFLKHAGAEVKATILLVEDSKVQKHANERILARAGYIVLSAMDGEQALSVAREKLPDMILLDMLLPKLSGIQVLRALQEQPATARIPVIALSTLPQVNEAKLRKEGVTAYFEKSRLVEDRMGEAAFVELLQKVLQESQERGPAAVAAHSS